MKKKKIEVVKNNETARPVLTADQESALIEGLGFLKGFLQMLDHTCRCDDALELMDRDGLQEVNMEAIQRLKKMEVAFWPEGVTS